MGRTNSNNIMGIPIQQLARDAGLGDHVTRLFSNQISIITPKAAARQFSFTR